VIRARRLKIAGANCCCGETAESISFGLIVQTAEDRVGHIMDPKNENFNMFFPEDSAKLRALEKRERFP
jgi:hypothetical protein